MEKQYEASKGVTILDDPLYVYDKEGIVDLVKYENWCETTLLPVIKAMLDAKK